MTLPNCSAGEYIRGDMTCVSVPEMVQQPGTIQQHDPLVGFCLNPEMLAIGGLFVLILIFCVLGAVSYGAVKQRRRPRAMLHDVCRRVHPLDEPCLFTDAQKELLRKHGNPLVFENAIISAIGEISIYEAQNAIAKYRRDWDEAG